MATSLTPQQVRQVRGRCSGCVHCAPRAPGAKSAPGASSICRLCVRNPEASQDAAVKSDSGNVVYGLRDCYISKDRFTMELKGETFFKGVHIGG